MSNERRHLSLGLGVPTILAVFILLCMCILSVLTYLNAHSNAASFRKEKQHIRAFYEADTRAKLVVSAKRSGVSEEEIYTKYEVVLNTSEGVTTFDVPISKTQTLYVELDEENAVRKWKSVRE